MGFVMFILRVFVPTFFAVALVVGCTSEETPEVQEAVAAEAKEEKKDSQDKHKSEEKAETAKKDKVEVLNGEAEKLSKETEIVAAEAQAKADVEKSANGETSKAAAPKMSEPQVIIVNLPDSEEESAEAQRTFTVTATHLNARSGPSMKFDVVKVVTAGSQFKALSVEGIWVQIEENLYVSKHFLKETTETAALEQEK